MVSRTQDAILDSFNRLIAKREIDKITVPMILKGAGVSKATFYRYFRDKYDVMNYNYKLMVDQFAKPEECTGYEDLFLHLFRYPKENLSYLKYIYSYHGMNSFSDYVYQYSYETILRITNAGRGASFSPCEEMQVDMFCQGVSYMLYKWISGQYQISPEEGARALYDMMPPTLKGYWL